MIQTEYEAEIKKWKGQVKRCLSNYQVLKKKSQDKENELLKKIELLEYKLKQAGLRSDLLETPDFEKSLKRYLEIEFNLNINRRIRKREYVECRAMYYYFMRKYTTSSLKHIGVTAGLYDHTSVMHGIKLCEDLIQVNREFKNRVAIFETYIKEHILKIE